MGHMVKSNYFDINLFFLNLIIFFLLLVVSTFLDFFEETLRILFDKKENEKKEKKFFYKNLTLVSQKLKIFKKFLLFLFIFSSAKQR